MTRQSINLLDIAEDIARNIERLADEVYKDAPFTPSEATARVANNPRLTPFTQLAMEGLTTHLKRAQL